MLFLVLKKGVDFMYKKLMFLFICLLLVLPLSYVTVKAGVNSSTSVSTNSPEISSIVSQTNSASKKEYGKSLTILKNTKDKGSLSWWLLQEKSW